MSDLSKRVAAACLVAGFFAVNLAFAQQWTDRVRGSWIGDEKSGGVTLTSGEIFCEIVVPAGEPSCVRQAAVFLAGDIEKITGSKPPIVTKRTEHRPAIELFTAPSDLADNAKWPWSFQKGAWEAYQIRTIDRDRIVCVGSNPRGTAFAAYTLCERLGVDPLHCWTLYEPEHHDPLIVKPTDFSAGPPTFKYRGMFHDDEDILPRPFENSGYPLRTGDVPNEWYARYFETALRLRMNMVAPYTRVHRRYEVQKMASDWGLFYTSHHYDILLSNPFGIERYGLAKARGVSATWDWIKNPDGMLKYWRGGVEENKDLDCIWPVGMRGTDDVSYHFPPGTSEAEQSKIFKDIIERQVAMTRDLLPKDKTPIFHWTLYSEMLPKYLSGKLEVPDDVIIVWPDDNDGTMRGLPTQKDRWKHGVYYHLAYLGKQVKQSAHIVPPAQIAREFRKIVDSGATEYMLVNVSELREFVMEARMLAEMCWDAKTALAGDDPAKRYVDWWCREYFGENAAADAAGAYAGYYNAFDTYDKQWFGSDRVHDALGRLHQQMHNGVAGPNPQAELGELKKRLKALDPLFESTSKARNKMTRAQRQFFSEHCEFPALLDYMNVDAAIALNRPGKEPLDRADLAYIYAAQDEIAILHAEHPPFENWYRETWIRRGPKSWNLHRPFEELRLFLSTGGKEFELPDPEPSRRRPTTSTTSTTSATSPTTSQ